eukprot:3315048-Prymnesium_polylepis.1
MRTSSPRSKATRCGSNTLSGRHRCTSPKGGRGRRAPSCAALHQPLCTAQRSRQHSVGARSPHGTGRTGNSKLEKE